MVLKLLVALMLDRRRRDPLRHYIYIFLCLKANLDCRCIDSLSLVLLVDTVIWTSASIDLIYMLLGIKCLIFVSNMRFLFATLFLRNSIFSFSFPSLLLYQTWLVLLESAGLLMCCRYSCLVRLSWGHYGVGERDKAVLVLIEWTDKLWRICDVVRGCFHFQHHHVVQILLPRSQSHQWFFATSIIDLATFLRWRYMNFCIIVAIAIAVVLNEKLGRFGWIEPTLLARVPLLLHESLLMLLKVILL